VYWAYPATTPALLLDKAFVAYAPGADPRGVLASKRGDKLIPFTLAYREAT